LWSQSKYQLNTNADITKSVNGLESALSVVARRKLEWRNVVFARGRVENGRWYSIPCSVVNVSVQSSLQKGLVEGFTSYALRNGKLEDIQVNIDWLQ
jgi:hypothetical protein